MLRRTTIRTRLLIGVALPLVALVAIVALNVRRSVGLGVAVGGVVVVAAIAAILIARSISRPITALAAQAGAIGTARTVDGRVVTDELLPPRLVDPGYGAELDTLARAIAAGRNRALQALIDQEHRQRTLRELSATSARRTTGVLAAALAQLDELAAAAEDADEPLAPLTNLQRLVARADRHATNLLVLLTDETNADAGDTPIADVLWAACMAVDAGDRIDFMSLADAHVKGSAVGDLAHLLAEILENAAAANGDGSRVTVLGEEYDLGYLLTVVDHGGGMDAETLASANKRVSSPSPDVLPSRALGLDVVGRLARRQGMLVRLGESSDGGVVVRVEVPAAVLTTAPIVLEDEHAIDRAAEAAELTETVEMTDVVEVVDLTEVPAPSFEPALAERAGVAFPADDAVTEPVAALSTADDDEPIEVQITAPPMPAPALAGLGSPSIIIDPLPYVVRISRPADELLPRNRKKKWSGALAKAGV
jgi:signal transduction histidine kinase